MAQENDGMAKGLIVGFIAGSIVGAAIALLYAPKAGKELRADIKEKTSDLMDDAQEYIVVTETGILHQMQKNNPDKTFIPAPPNNSCACNDCPHMKLNTLEKLYLCMKYELPEIIMEENLRIAAKKPIEKMLEISAKYGL